MNSFRALVAALLVLAVFAPPAAAQSPGLVAAYGFEETAGTTAVDSSGAGNAGTLAGPTRSASGRFGAALAFDGTDDRVNVNDSASLDLSSGMTVEAWIRPEAGDWRTAVIKERPGGLAYALWASTDSNRPAGEVQLGSATEVRSASALPMNVWTHLATTYDGATLRLYVNGSLTASRAASGAIQLSSGALRIGGNAIWGEYFRGLIDEVRVYNRALTAGEIQADMNAAIIPADAEPPTAPTGLTATANGDDVHLEWGAATDNVGVTGYRVFRDGAVLATLGAAARAYDDLDRPSGSYRYHVVAVDAAGLASAASNEETATVVDPDAEAPTAPVVTASITSRYDVHVTWTPATDDLGVKEYRVHSSGQLIGTVSGTTHEFTHARPPWGTRHYTVTAVDNAGHSTSSAVVAVRLDPATTPPVPIFDSPCDGTKVHDAIEIRAFQPDVILSSRTAYAEVDGRVVWGPQPIGGVSNVSFLWETRSVFFPDGPHVMRMHVNYPDGTELVSEPCVFNVDNFDVTASLVAPANGATVSGTITLDADVFVDGQPLPADWSDWYPPFMPVRSVRFEVDGSNTAGAPQSHELPFQASVDTTSLPNGPHTFRGLVGWMHYGMYRATTQTVTVNVDNSPSQPTGVTATATGDDVLVSWNAVTANPAVTSYRVFRDGTQIATVTGTSYTDADRPVGTYEYEVVAVNSRGASQRSAPAEVHVDDEPAPPAGLVAAYGFEHASGTTATDSSATGAHGTISGATSTADGRFGRALSFDGANDMVTVPDANALDLAPGMTLSAWVKPSSAGGWRTVLLKERPGQLVYALFSSADNGRPMAEVAASAQRDARGTAALPVGVWSHLAATHDGSTLRLFVNGAQVASTAVSGALTNSAGALRIGGNTVWGEWFHGAIDEVRVYERALGAAEIQADRDRALVPGT